MGGSGQAEWGRYLEIQIRPKSMLIRLSNLKINRDDDLKGFQCQAEGGNKDYFRDIERRMISRLY